jgi:hypothetical protein
MSATAFYAGSATALGFASSPLIEVSLIWGPWFIPPAYINKPYPPPGEEAIKPRSQKIRRISSWNDPTFRKGNATDLKCNRWTSSYHYPILSQITESYMNIRVQVEGLHHLLSSPCRAEHSHAATRTSSRRQQRKLGLLAPSWVQREPLLLPVILLVILGLQACQKSISTLGTSHASPTLWCICFVELDAFRDKKKNLFLVVVSYASNQYFKSISLSNFNPSYSHTLSYPHTHLITTPHLISLSHRHGQLPLIHVSTASAGTPLW